MSQESSLPDINVKPGSRVREETTTRRVPPYHVILENDDYHSFEFVVKVLRQALGYTEQRAHILTKEAHTAGRAVVWTGSKEVAELKLDQIRSFHETRAVDGAKLGPLGCAIEPAPAG